MSQALLGVEGVTTADVSYDDKRAKVTYAADQVEVSALIQAVGDAGFEATVIAPE